MGGVDGQAAEGDGRQAAAVSALSGSPPLRARKTIGPKSRPTGSFQTPAWLPGTTGHTDPPGLCPAQTPTRAWTVTGTVSFGG